jgi:ribosomal protein S18 acetylase RimI-like enzyme
MSAAHLIVGSILALSGPRSYSRLDRSPLVAARSCARSTGVAATAAVREVDDWRGDWAAAQTLAQVFGGPAMFHLSSLRAPQLTANVFFAPLEAPVVAVATTADGEQAGVVQLLQVRLTEAAAGSAAKGAPVAFVQNVAVVEAARRQGVARALVAWCEAHARAQWPAVEEAWLAVGVDNAPAIALYETLGYERRTVSMGNVVMRRPLVADDAADVDGNAPAAPSAATATPPRAPAFEGSSQGGESGSGTAAKSPLAGLLGGLASALESVLDAGFPGQLLLVRRSVSTALPPPRHRCATAAPPPRHHRATAPPRRRAAAPRCLQCPR